jgi:hypothetical protein
MVPTGMELVTAGALEATWVGVGVAVGVGAADATALAVALGVAVADAVADAAGAGCAGSGGCQRFWKPKKAAQAPVAPANEMNERREGIVRSRVVVVGWTGRLREPSCPPN